MALMKYRLMTYVLDKYMDSCIRDIYRYFIKAAVFVVICLFLRGNDEKNCHIHFQMSVTLPIPPLYEPHEKQTSGVPDISHCLGNSFILCFFHMEPRGNLPSTFQVQQKNLLGNVFFMGFLSDDARFVASPILSLNGGTSLNGNQHCQVELEKFRNLLNCLKKVYTIMLDFICDGWLLYD